MATQPDPERVDYLFNGFVDEILSAEERNELNALLRDPEISTTFAIFLDQHQTLRDRLGVRTNATGEAAQPKSAKAFPAERRIRRRIEWGHPAYWYAAAAVLLITVASYLLFGTRSKDPYEIALLSVSGRFEIENPGGEGWQNFSSDSLRWNSRCRLRPVDAEGKVVLSDGSALTLRGRAQIKASQLEPMTIDLRNGELYCEIPHDRAASFSAPRFIVQTEEMEARVVGTKFNVKRMGSKTEVAVTEGEVVCANKNGQEAVKAGESTESTSGSKPLPATSWVAADTHAEPVAPPPQNVAPPPLPKPEPERKPPASVTEARPEAPHEIPKTESKASATTPPGAPDSIQPKPAEPKPPVAEARENGLPVGAVIHAMIFDGQGRLFAQVNELDVFVSKDQGETWARSSKGLQFSFKATPQTRMLFALNGQGRVMASFFSTPPDPKIAQCFVELTNDNWTPSTLPAKSDGLRAISAEAKGTVLASDNLNLYRSTDGGLKWDVVTALSVIGGTTELRCLAADPVTGGILAGTNRNSFWYSADLGKTWRGLFGQTVKDSAQGCAVSVRYSKSGTAVCIEYSYKYKSFRNFSCAKGQPKSIAGLPTEELAGPGEVNVAQGSGTFFELSPRHGIYESRNDGEKWSVIEQADEKNPFSCWAVSADGTVVFATNDGKIHRVSKEK